MKHHPPYTGHIRLIFYRKHNPSGIKAKFSVKFCCFWSPTCNSHSIHNGNSETKFLAAMKRGLLNHHNWYCLVGLINFLTEYLHLTEKVITKVLGALDCLKQISYQLIGWVKLCMDGFCCRERHVMYGWLFESKWIALIDAHIRLTVVLVLFN